MLEIVMLVNLIKSFLLRLPFHLKFLALRLITGYKLKMVGYLLR